MQDKKIKVKLYEFNDSVYLNQESLAKLFLKKFALISQEKICFMQMNYLCCLILAVRMLKNMFYKL
ncbi:hypothetical protein LS81_004955 [Helicobacter trogontum]|uniref:Uncharacterized protein n=1 Tax=Helicobacter trogontum TaxID=50960 RepID=A0A4U8SBG3_9HELI|nr:hypothetical protein LS81_004955 [Helicobacter trogontum]